MMQNTSARRIAIVGSGIAGLGTAWLLQKQGHAVTVFEANGRAGGHSQTVDVTLEGITHPVDTGFLVFNDRTYPLLLALFAALGVRSVKSEMSFSVRNDAERIEWAGTSVATLFANPRNACRTRFWSMLADIVRFNAETRRLLANDALPDLTLGDFLERRRFGTAFRDWYLLPMAAAIWSSPRRTVVDHPLPTFVRFCHNHGLLQVTNRPQWRTVLGGSRAYVERIVARLHDVRLACPALRIRRRATGVDVDSDRALGERFDEVVLACHSDQALRLLADATPCERRLLGRIAYQSNRVILHTDASLLPRSRRAWSSWNYLAADDGSGARPVAVSYLINKLQPLPFRTPVIVTLNPPFDPDPRCVLDAFEYAHPVLGRDAVAAQAGFAALQGQRYTWYAGAWLGHGFHEDGLASAHAVATGVAASELGRDHATLQRAAA